jgi:hypothetical protein
MNIYLKINTKIKIVIIILSENSIQNNVKTQEAKNIIVKIIIKILI